MRRWLILGLLILVVLMAAFVCWVAAVKPIEDMFVAPSLLSHPHFLVVVSMRFPSTIYSRMVRIKAATYRDLGQRFYQDNVWVYENPVYASTDADESTLSDLYDITDYRPKGKQTIAFLFKLRDAAYIGPDEQPLRLPTGPYEATIQYKVLWFTRTVSFSFNNSIVK